MISFLISWVLLLFQSLDSRSSTEIDPDYWFCSLLCMKTLAHLFVESPNGSWGNGYYDTKACLSEGLATFVSNDFGCSGCILQVACVAGDDVATPWVTTIVWNLHLESLTPLSVKNAEETSLLSLRKLPIASLYI